MKKKLKKLDDEFGAGGGASPKTQRAIASAVKNEPKKATAKKATTKKAADKEDKWYFGKYLSKGVKSVKKALAADAKKQKAHRAKRQERMDRAKRTTSVHPISKHHTKKEVKVETKAGDYHVYDKKSKTAQSFRSAFKSKCTGGATGFTWNNKSYSCARKGDVKKGEQGPKTKSQTARTRVPSSKAGY